MNVLLDSAILFDHLRGVPAATAYLKTVHPVAAISVLARAEVLSNLDCEAAVRALPLLDLFPILTLTANVADRAALLRREHRWKLPDALEVALALENTLTFATPRTDIFPPSRHSFVHVPYGCDIVAKSA